MGAPLFFLLTILLSKVGAFRSFVALTARPSIIEKQHLAKERHALATTVREDDTNQNASHPNFDDKKHTLSSRRIFVQHALVLPAYVVTQSAPSWAADQETTSPSALQKVLVLGGTGFVGSVIVQLLRERGLQVVATSRNGRNGTVALKFDPDSTTPTQAQLSKLTAGCTAVISCVGAIGTPNDLTINASTARVAQVAAKNDVSRFVYITVAPEVRTLREALTFCATTWRANPFRGKPSWMPFPKMQYH